MAEQQTNLEIATEIANKISTDRESGSDYIEQQLKEINYGSRT